MARTWWSRSAARATTWVPMPPEAPNTAICMVRFSSKTVLISTVQRLALNGPISTVLARLRSGLRETCVHRDPQRRRVLAGLAQQQPSFDAGQQRRGQHRGGGVRAQFSPLTHSFQRVGEKLLPGVERGGGLPPRVLVALGHLGRQ